VALYTEKILRHARLPKKFARIAHPDVQVEEFNPLCGDRVRIELRFGESGDVIEAGFSGEMCAIAKGSASILLESIEGMNRAALGALSDAQVLENLGGPIDSARVKCALLPISALRGAIRGASF
jgi:nitrogen fixation NifU-like protein